MRSSVLLLLTAGLMSCASGPAPDPVGEAAPAGLPGEAIDPSFEYAEMPDDGDQDPGADIPGIDP